MPKFTLPDQPPSGRTLPAHELRERARALEWMHEMAAPHRKKRVDPLPANMDEMHRQAFGDAYTGEE